MNVSIDGFEANLQELHHEENPTILDDELPGAFADWVSNLDYSTIREMAQTYCYKMGERGRWKEIADGYWTRYFGPLPTEGQKILFDANEHNSTTLETKVTGYCIEGKCYDISEKEEKTDVLN